MDSDTDIMRSVLRFQICLREILPHNPHAEQLDSTDKSDNAHKGRPAIDRIPEKQSSHNDENNCGERYKGKDNSTVRGKGERYLGEVDNAVEGILKQLPETPLCFPGNTFYVLDNGSQ